MSTAAPEFTSPEIGNRIIRGLLAYFDRTQGAAFVEAVLAESGLERSYFDDVEAWVSTSWAAAFTASVMRRLAGSAEPGMDDPAWQHWVDAGRDSMSPGALGSAWS